MKLKTLALASLVALAPPTLAQEETVEPWLVHRVAADLSVIDPDAGYWSAGPDLALALVAQPMIRPRPAAVTTPDLTVRAVHDGTWMALRLTWKDSEPSEAGRLGEYSDGAAVQFPLAGAESPPPIFMGVRGNPVHIFHWRAQYQRDHERGKPTMRDLYPNLSIDMYPMEYADPGSADPSLASREQYSPGRAVGNPQSFPKSGVDEIYAEGVSTSSVQESAAFGRGRWRDGEWTLVLVRPLAREGGSSFAPGDSTFVAFAVWQGGHDEVGARKSLTMTWTPIRFAGDAAVARPPGDAAPRAATAAGSAGR
jgi:hypothetical protein